MDRCRRSVCRRERVREREKKKYIYIYIYIGNRHSCQFFLCFHKIIFCKFQTIYWGVSWTYLYSFFAASPRSFRNGVLLIWIYWFLSPRWVALLIYYSWEEKTWILIFPEDINSEINTKSLVQDWQRFYFLCYAKCTSTFIRKTFVFYPSR